MSVLLLLGLANAQDASMTLEEAFQAGQSSFSELSDISRNVTEELEAANKSNDMEQVQCIKSRQTSISALLDISKQSLSSLQGRSLKPILANAELRKIKLALKTAKQYEAEVKTCMANQNVLGKRCPLAVVIS